MKVEELVTLGMYNIKDDIDAIIKSFNANGYPVIVENYDEDYVLLTICEQRDI